MRRIALPFAMAALLLVPATAFGHTELTSSDPADGAVVTEAPTEVTITFGGEIDEDASFTVTAEDGTTVGEGELDLDVADRNALRGAVEITDAGTYTIAYVIVGEDGHEVSGELTFTYDPDGEATNPDTAMAVPNRSPALPVGLLLVALSAALTIRRVVRARR